MPVPTALINVVALSSSLLGDASPRLNALAARGAVRRLRPVLPAVTCSVQSSMLTGAPVRDHGIVGNGWYDRTLAEVHFWKQSNRLVAGEKVWEAARARDASVTSANMFWWYNMYSSADWSVTPRPIYKADGRKLPDVYSEPPALRDELQRDLGQFPLFHFWGPASDLRSTRWIADAAIAVHRKHAPTLMTVYLPHLDYGLQKLGPGHPDIPSHVRAVDAVVGDLVDYYDAAGVRTVLVSEYGIEAVDRPVALNRVLREAGHVRVRVEEGLELLDPGASAAFAVCDHQVAHVYVRDPADVAGVADLLRSVDGVERVLGADEQRAEAIDHARTGDLVVVAERGAWFAYPWWLDDARAPDFARTVDIHRKPGYDPVELFLDPAIRVPPLAIGWRLARKRLGFRQLMDVIPLDPTLVRGSHGRTDQPADEQPLLITPGPHPDGGDELPCTAVRDVVLQCMFGRP